MKIRVENSIKHLLLIYLIFLAAFILATGCATKPQPDPLAGWHYSSLDNLDANKAISDDYHEYLKELNLKNGRAFIGSVSFSEDGNGQHAVDIKVGAQGTWWEHVLIYDKDNKRTKVIKYSNGGYSS